MRNAQWCATHIISHYVLCTVQLYILLDWESSCAWKLIFLCKSQPTQLRIVLTIAKHIPVVLLGSSLKICGNSVKRLIRHSRTSEHIHKQTNKKTPEQRLVLLILLAWEPCFAWKLSFNYKSQPTQLINLRQIGQGDV